MTFSRISILYVVLLITFFSFFPSLFNDFTNWDDPTHLLDNAHVRSLSFDNIFHIFSSTIHNTYIPLTTLSYALEYHFFQFNPWIYHINNLALHLIVVILVFQFALRCGLSSMASGMAALLFGIHPMHVESVAWITERKDVLYAAFYMLSLNCYADYSDMKDNKKYILAVLFGLASILSKAMALTLPLVFLLYDWFKKRAFSKRMLLDKIPFILFIAPITWITFSANTVIYSSQRHWEESILICLWSFIFYVPKFFLPLHLSPYYPLSYPVSLTNIFYVLAVVQFILFWVALYVFRNKRLFVLACVFYIANVFYLVKFDAVDYIQGVIVADRFMYVASIGFCLLIGAVLEKGVMHVQDRKWFGLNVFLIGVIGVVVLLSLKTFHQSKVWKNGMTLWTHVIEHNPETAMAYNNRANIFMEQKNYARAIEDYNQAIHYRPRARYFSNRGSAYSALKNYDRALQDFRQAIALRPKNFAAYYNRGIVYFHMKDFDNARRDFKMSLHLNPQHRSAQRYLDELP